MGEYEDYKNEERRFEAQQLARELLFEEFEQTYTDMDIAKEMIIHDDFNMSFEEMKEILFDEYINYRY